MSRVKNVVTQSDYNELSEAYKFVIDDERISNNKDDSSWQDRMVRKYHEHLYKTHVIADLSRFETSQVGLRWRTKSEVASGKGVDSCGNKHCPCYFENKRKRKISEVMRWKELVDHRQALDQYFQSCKKYGIGTKEDEIQRLQQVPHGLGIFDYEVHFSYKEKNVEKEELVKLKLCLRCAPKIFYAEKGGAIGARTAREREMQTKSESIEKGSSIGSSVASSEHHAVNEKCANKEKNSKHYDCIGSKRKIDEC